MSREEWSTCGPWDGNKKTMPLDVELQVTDLTIEDIIKEQIKTRSGKIIGVEIDEDLFDTLVSNWGKKAILIVEPAASYSVLDRWEWRAKYGTDGLKLAAIKKLLPREHPWLGCVPWEGEEKALPLGGQIRAPGVTIEDLVKEYIKTKSGKIMGAIIDEDEFDKLVATWGDRAVVISQSDDIKKGLDRWEWKEKYGTDGLELWAIKKAFSDSPDAFKIP